MSNFKAKSPAPSEVDGQAIQQEQQESVMPIGNVVQRGNMVYVYDEQGRQLTGLMAGTRPGDGLKGYTGSTVNIQLGNMIHTYDERGRKLSDTMTG